MKHAWKGTALLLVAALVTTACTGRRDRSEVPGEVDLPVGGTLRVGMAFDFAQNLDPHKEYPSAAAWELYRCCLLRTLLSYSGRPTEEGGTGLSPDLAAEMPDVSSDGLTWTFRLKTDLRYAPPLDDHEIVAADIIRGLLRAADPVGSAAGAYSFYFSVIEGFDDAYSGNVDSISGLSAPDDHTIVVRLERPTGDLGYRLSLPAAAPIPPQPFDPDAPMGVADGHGGDYGRYLVSSGPYMLGGSENLDFSKPPLLQPGVAGFQSGTSVTLVRNPSWSREQDPLRPAYVDQIEITNYLWRDDFDELASYVEDGQLDFVFDANPPPDQLARFSASTDLKDRVFRNESNTVRYLSINTAVQPFDDEHVRRAVALAIDKSALGDALRETGWLGEPATHLAVDSLEEGLLGTYEPFAGGLEAARNEMRMSAYDRDRDGRCDDPACNDVSYREVYERVDDPMMAETIRASIERIGVSLAVQPLLPAPTSQPALRSQTALVFGFRSLWQADYPNATTFFASLFSGAMITEGTSGRSPNLNHSLLGATPEQLQGWGYSVDRVPNVDDRISQCVALLGFEQVRCWAELDQLLMGEVVPAVPIAVDLVVRIVSDRVMGYSFDQFTAMPALDQIALAAGSE